MKINEQEKLLEAHKFEIKNLKDDYKAKWDHLEDVIRAR